MKYEITDIKHPGNPNLRRIRALKDFANVEAGDLGGWIENEGNLSQDGVCWIYENAQVYGSAQVYENARICGNAWVYSGGITNKFQVFNIPILKYNLTIFPGGISGGCRKFTHEEFEQLTLEKCRDKSWTAEELDLYKSFLGTWRRIQGVYTREIKQSSNDH